MTHKDVRLARDRARGEALMKPWNPPVKKVKIVDDLTGEVLATVEAATTSEALSLYLEMDVPLGTDLWEERSVTGKLMRSVAAVL